MKLASFRDDKGIRIGVVVGEHIVDLAIADPTLPADMVALLEAGDDAMVRARRAAETGPRRLLAEVTLCAPVQRPPEFLIVGVNYRDHGDESVDIGAMAQLGLAEILADAGSQTVPLIVNKQSSCVNGPYDDVVKPRMSEMVDYEAEMAIVIGQRCRNVTRAQAPAMIAGYMCANDVSARDWQWKSPTHTLGKSFESHGPTGPWIVTADELGDPHALDITCRVNGEVRQSFNTGQMIFDAFGLIEILSSIFPLLPGTIILTGTGAGVGCVMEPPVFLQPGDVVEVEIEKIGKIRNQVVAEAL